MASQFSFGFGGDDIDIDEDFEAASGAEAEKLHIDGKKSRKLVEPFVLEVDDLVSYFLVWCRCIPLVLRPIALCSSHLTNYPSCLEASHC